MALVFERLDPSRSQGSEFVNMSDQHPFVRLTMSNGAQFTVRMELRELVGKLNTAMKESQLVAVPMGLQPPWQEYFINPQQVVDLLDVK